MDDRYKAYAIAANRDTPEVILNQMVVISKKLSDLGYTLRSNGSDVPGDCVEKDALRVELFLPWKNFNKKTSRTNKPTADAFELAKRYSPVYDKLTDVVKSLIAVNSHLILGESLKDPVNFLICWTPDGAEHSKECTGKTGIASQAIKIASTINIPVVNLKRPGALDRIKSLIG